jgi:hypothetical protein
MSAEQIASISALIPLVAWSATHLLKMIDRRVKTVVKRELKSLEKKVDDIRISLTEHSVKIDHLEDTTEKHDTRLSSLENT